MYGLTSLLVHLAWIGYIILILVHKMSTYDEYAKYGTQWHMKMAHATKSIVVKLNKDLKLNDDNYNIW